MIKFRQDKDLMIIIKRKFKNAKIEIIRENINKATALVDYGFTVTDEEFEKWYHENKLVIPKEFKYSKQVNGKFEVYKTEIVDNDFPFSEKQNEHIKKLLSGEDMLKTFGNIFGGK